MCGRTACGKNPDEICNICSQNINKGEQIIQWKNIDGEYSPSYNKAPQSYNPILVSSSFVENNEKNVLSIVPMYWTLIPSWFNGGIDHFKYKTINCRKEGIAGKTMFKSAINKNFRCVVLADGYYEWQKKGAGPGKQPYFFYFPECATTKQESSKQEWFWTCPHLMMLAAIFDIHHKKTEENPFYSYSIITVPAHPTVAWIHDRMPAVLDSSDAVKTWLDPKVSSEEALELVQPYGKLHFHPVSTEVNNVRNRGIELIYPIKVSEQPTSKKVKAEKVDTNTPEITEFFGKGKTKHAKVKSQNVSVKSELDSPKSISSSSTESLSNREGSAKAITKRKKVGGKGSAKNAPKRKKA